MVAAAAAAAASERTSERLQRRRRRRRSPSALTSFRLVLFRVIARGGGPFLRNKTLPPTYVHLMPPGKSEAPETEEAVVEHRTDLYYRRIAKRSGVRGSPTYQGIYIYIQDRVFINFFTVSIVGRASPRATS